MRTSSPTRRGRPAGCSPIAAWNGRIAAWISTIAPRRCPRRARLRCAGRSTRTRYRNGGSMRRTWPRPCASSNGTGFPWSRPRAPPFDGARSGSAEPIAQLHPDLTRGQHALGVVALGHARARQAEAAQVVADRGHRIGVEDVVGVEADIVGRRPVGDRGAALRLGGDVRSDAPLADARLVVAGEGGAPDGLLVPA